MASLSIGIVGLPNVGKSTLFNTLLKKQVAQAENYPFCTIEPNKGIVEVPDARLAELAKIVHTTTLLPAAVEFYDIAGIVKGASQGEGLGNKFLSHIREVSAIVHVLRFFDDENVLHVAHSVDPTRDLEIIETELILADLETIEKRKEPKGKATEDDLKLWQASQKIKTMLDSGKYAIHTELSDEEKVLVKGLNLLTMKPTILVCNISENQLQDKENTIQKVEQSLKSYYKDGIPPYLLLSVKIEQEISSLPPEELQEYLSLYRITEPGLDALIKKAYALLGLQSFLTAGEKEVRAWTIEAGTLAPQASAVIHTDFEKKFIKADIVSYSDFIICKGWLGAREQGKVTSAGRDYAMQEGDIVEFKIGA